MKMINITFLIGLLLSTTLFAEEHAVKLEKANIDPTDVVSLQMGAKTFMNYCAGCHSLQYVRYNALGKGIGIVDEKGNLLEDAIKENLIFGNGKITDTIARRMPAASAESWFGIVPPDLSLSARVRSINWLYTYLKSFYRDNSKPWGVNNLVYPDVAMPHVLVNLQGVQVPVYKKGSDNKIIESLILEKPGTQSAAEYDQTIKHLVNFLGYVAEPIQQERKRLGVWVLLFLGVFFVFATLLKKEYWKDIH